MTICLLRAVLQNKHDDPPGTSLDGCSRNQNIVVREEEGVTNLQSKPKLQVSLGTEGVTFHYVQGNISMAAAACRRISICCEIKTAMVCLIWLPFCFSPQHIERTVRASSPCTAPCTERPEDSEHTQPTTKKCATGGNISVSHWQSLHVFLLSTEKV